MFDDRLALSVKEVARQLGLSTDSVYEAVHKGSIPSVRLSRRGRILIPRATVERMMAEAAGEDALPVASA
ncbi:MAG: helix-turn-helix domain-containing protein [Chloroflexota bacterium]|nr:helix-turn-helix domain-containing protein [Chloroflexota bacterium]MDE2941428.1 helix-turn-helix domain-containing protein [Chloroflexota bacterium]MDE3267654.1 helix-turn-helix domain-containing protein [Chloroflexota bacterium]